MAGEGRRWPRSGRRRQGRDDYGGEDDYGQHSGQNGRGSAYQDADGYGQRAGYGSDDSHGWPGGYGQSGDYGGTASYGSPDGYGDQASYADPRSYGDQPEYGEPNGYRDGSGYGDPYGYGGSGGYQWPGGYGDHERYGEPGYAQSGYDQSGYGDPGDYGAGPGNQGRHSGGSAAGLPDPARHVPDEDRGYAPDFDTNPYGPGSHGPADQYGQGAPGSYGSGSDYGRGRLTGPDDVGTVHEPDPASGYQWQGPYGAADPLPPASYDAGSSYPAESARGYDTGSFGRADTGSHAGWAFTPGARGYESDPYGQGAEAHPGPPADGFGADSGTFGRPDTGSFGRGDSETFGRPDTGSFGRGDSGTFGRPDTGSLGRDEYYDGDHDPGQDTGSIRWNAGPPAVKIRADRDGEYPAEPARRALPAGSGSYPDWRDDPVDDDWEDDGDGRLLSRRFGSGRDRGDGGGRARDRKPRRLRSKAAFTAAILTVALVVGIAAAFGYKYVNSWINNRYGNYSGAGTGTVEITVTEGATLAGLGPVLLSKGVIMALRPYDSAAAAASGTLQPGVYRLHHHMNSAIAVTYLLNPKYRSDIKVTIIEGKRATEIAALLAAKTGLKESAFLQLINHPPASLGLPSWAAGKTAEGFLFPDTYTFLPGESALKILQTMVHDFNTKIASISLASAAPLVHTTPWHVLIVASLAQAEGNNSADFGKIARVAWNRLIQNMYLDFDSTVFYGLHISGNQQARATSAEVKKDTPYNTYLHRGLPPGPIGNPGLDAIKAALHPTHGQWLYFITDLKTQKTYFTASQAQFLQWQKQFQG
jgi:uncharacterized YceG family protein